MGRKNESKEESKEEQTNLTSNVNFEQEQITQKEEQPKRRSFLSMLREFLVLLIIAYVVAFLIKTFLVQPFKIEQQSMLPTLYPNERVLVNRFIYRLREPKQGDIITFNAQRQNKVLIKRIIATEGETIKIVKGKVHIDGKQIKEPYVIDSPDFSNCGPLKVPENHIFVMGDNRPNSGDSRMFGAVPEDDVLGEAFLVYWPLNKTQTI